MSFTFDWPTFAPDFYEDAKAMLSTALNKGEKPALIADRIDVRQLDMGTIPPELEMLEIGDLSKERFRGIFRLTYAGDAFIELQTAIQANPLTQRKPAVDALPSPSILFASAPLRVPMRLRLSDLRLRAIIVLVVSRAKGITLVFKNDPLEAVTVSSTFDSVAVIQGFIQREIEGQLREMFRADLPGIIHRLSQRWLAENARTTEARNRFDPTARIETRTETPHESATSTVRMRPSLPMLSQSPLSTSPRRLAGRTSAARLVVPKLASDLDAMSVADSIEAYDPSYGLRPESLPSQAPLLLNSGLWSPGGRANRGLGEVLEAEVDEGVPEADESVDGLAQSEYSVTASTMAVEYDHFPAVGGGMITRPRILHSQSQMSVSTSGRSPDETRPGTSRSADTSVADDAESIHWALSGQARAVVTGRNTSVPLVARENGGMASPSPYPRTPFSVSASSSSVTSPRTHFSRGTSSLFLPTLASSWTTASPPRSPSPPQDASLSYDKPPSPPPLLSAATQGVTLTTAANNDRCAHLATLGQTHNTLSPLTRQLDHIAARTHVLSRAHRAEGRVTPSGATGQARRRRLHVIGAADKLAPPVDGLPSPISPPPSIPDWREDDGMDEFSRYFPLS